MQFQRQHETLLFFLSFSPLPHDSTINVHYEFFLLVPYKSPMLVILGHEPCHFRYFHLRQTSITNDVHGSHYYRAFVACHSSFAIVALTTSSLCLASGSNYYMHTPLRFAFTLLWYCRWISLQPPPLKLALISNLAIIFNVDELQLHPYSLFIYVVIS